MDENFKNAGNHERLSVEPPDKNLQARKAGRRLKTSQSSAHLDLRSKLRPADSAMTVSIAEPEGPHIEIRFEKRVTSEMLWRQEKTLVCAPFQDIKWREIMVLGRGIADVLAAAGEFPAERLSVSVAISLSPHEAQPLLRIFPSEPASSKLQASETREQAGRAFSLLSDDALTGLATSVLAARSGLEVRCVDAIRRLRIALPGRRLDSRLEIDCSAWDSPIFVSPTLCEPYRPKVERVSKTYRGEVSGFDRKVRHAYFYRDCGDRRLEISFDESAFFERIHGLSATRKIVEVEVLEELADDLPVGYELSSITVIQDELKLEPPEADSSTAVR
jgi:hypothetical protein